MTKLIPPRSDLVFKRVFGDERHIDILTAFLQAVLELPIEEYAEVRLANTHLPVESQSVKSSILDVMVTTTSGRSIDVEIQVKLVENLAERVVFYNARMLAAQLGKGKRYKDLRQAITIVILACNLLPDDEYHHRFHMAETETGLRFSEVLQIDTLELMKLPEHSDGSALWKWLKFVAAETEQELDMAGKSDPMIGKAATIVRHFSAEEEARIHAEMELKWANDLASMVGEAGDKGQAKGEHDALVRVANSMLASGFDVDQIASLTGLSEDEIKELIQ
ncbi:MAG: Rpn family recombination-promoting nuclease/putative transposase [Propionibacteriaceae bacterium]|nr:Rpn family recombination-promoting nuclease/putative transposase [Propionibacteriaceae bacterium]